jgi:hypothetical protein
MLTTITGRMDAKLRIITHLPVAELFRDDGFSTVERGRSLSREDVRQLLTSGPVQFVVADVGAAPRWIPESDNFRFWKEEAKTHLASDAKVHLAEFPDQYCYFASQWDAHRPEAPIILLEKHH